MSARLAAAKAILKADPTLSGIATGGIYDMTDLGRLGLNRKNALAATAFDSDRAIKPCIVLKVRAAFLVEGVSDDVAQKQGQQETLWLFFYEDAGYTIIDSMKARAYALLQGKRVGGVACRRGLTSPQSRDIDLDANVQTVDYNVWSVSSGG